MGALPELVRHELQATGAPDVAALVPKRAGVIQLLGSRGESLVVAHPANLNRWLRERLGLAPTRLKRRSAPVDLSKVAVAVRFATTGSAFQQTLLFERVMGEHTPPGRRRDLKPPGYLQLDGEARFPRVAVRASAGDGRGVYGPWPTRAAAQKARDALHRLFPLRPCDYEFEPAPNLPLGLGCLYAQVRSCSAPCLERLAERDYRRLAGNAAAFLARPSARPDTSLAWIPPWVTGVRGSRAVVAAQGRAGVELYPVRDGMVFDPGAAVGPDAAAAVAALRWPSAIEPGRDLPWLTAWLRGRRKRDAFVVLEEEPSVTELTAAVEAALARVVT